MAVGAFTLTNNGKLKLLDRTIDFVGSTTLKAVLVTATHTASTSDSTYADISANECADVDYSPVTLTGMSITGATGTVKYDANQVDYGSAVSISARWIYLVESANDILEAGDLILGYMDLNDGGTNVSSTNSDFKVDWDATNGLMTK